MSVSVSPGSKYVPSAPIVVVQNWSEELKKS